MGRKPVTTSEPGINSRNGSAGEHDPKPLRTSVRVELPANCRELPHGMTVTEQTDRAPPSVRLAELGAGALHACFETLELCTTP